MPHATSFELLKMEDARPLRARQMLGKYRIQKLVGRGGFAKVYKAMDTIEGTEVALKIPHAQFLDEDMLSVFKNEVRTVAKLDHPAIVRLKDASIIDGRFVVVTRFGRESLDERLKRRMSVTRALHFLEQMFDAVAYAHECGLIHCDIKPENFIIFDDDSIRLADFGIAKVASKTVYGSGTGTVGRMAPEQAMGRPSKKSDVFSLGLIAFRMLAGQWPEYPFQWPPRGAGNLRRKRIHPDLIAFIKKSISVTPRERFRDGVTMFEAFRRLHPKALKHLERR